MTVEYEVMEYEVYVKINETGYITSVNSSEFISDISNWIKIDSGYGDKYHHAQGNYFQYPILTDGGAYRYKLADGKAVECTSAEIKAQEEKNKPVHIAPRNIIEGEYITVSGVMYKVTANIPNGTPIITGQNAVETTVEEQLAELAKGE